MRSPPRFVTGGEIVARGEAKTVDEFIAGFEATRKK
jgi:hypothetical protein